MHPPQLDAVIAGGGLSGLSLAARLAAGTWRDRRVLVVDDAGRVPTAQSWAGWSARPGLLDAAVSRTYRQVLVHAGGQSRVVPLGRYRYQLVHRRDLERVVLDRLRGCPGFSVLDGRVERVGDGTGAAEVVVDGGVVRASWAFDSVSPVPAAGEPDARLAFTGWRVRCDRPVFAPDTPTLFDFRTPQVGGARFVYVLPDDRHSALVELTEFVPRHARPPEPAQRAGALRDYLDGVLGASGFETTHTEAAVLALRVRPPARRTGRVLAIGAHGGLVKASTGYAYQRIQRDSAAIAASLARHGHPFAGARPRRRYRLLDAVLLEVLDRDPGQLERAFARLFFANPAERVLRFLDEETRVPAELRLVASLPPGPYLRALPPLALRRAGLSRRR